METLSKDEADIWSIWCSLPMSPLRKILLLSFGHQNILNNRDARCLYKMWSTIRSHKGNKRISDSSSYVSYHNVFQMALRVSAFFQYRDKECLNRKSLTHSCCQLYKSTSKSFVFCWIRRIFTCDHPNKKD